MFNLTDVYRWYYNRLEDIDSPEFLRALKEGQTLYKGIAGVAPQVHTVRTYNTSAQQLNIPLWALNPELYEEISHSPQYAMAGIVNGIIAHSAALHRWLDDFVSVPFQLNADLSIQVANLVHDIWITSHNTRWMFFVKLYFDFLYSTPDTNDVVKFIGSWRSEQCQEVISQATPEIAEQLERISALSTKKDRREIIQNIIDLLLQEQEEDKQDQDGQEQDKQEEQDDEQGNSEDQNEQDDKQDGSEDQDEQDDEQGDPDNEQGEGCKQESVINQVPFEEKLDLLSQFSTSARVTTFAKAIMPEKKDETVDVKTHIIKTLEGYEPVDHNGDFTQLGTLLDEKMSQRPKKVRPEITGKRLQKRQLHRLATDGKVFGTSKIKRKVLPKQIFFMLDASSSIDSSVGYTPILEAVSGALKGLKMGRNKCYTVAYTTNDSQEPVLTILGTPDSLQKVNAYPKISHQFTPEPFMLRTMREYIKKNRLPKHDVFVFVLNDGSPCMLNFSDRTLFVLSQQEVKKLREDGVNVIALALTEEVIDSDSRIYGPEYTVDAQNLKQTVLKILSELD